MNGQPQRHNHPVTRFGDADARHLETGTVSGHEGEAIEMTEANAPRVRMDPQVRKALLRATARQVFADRGYAASGLAEIADRAGVNKRLCYYYYPKGRPQLFTEVMGELTAELIGVIHAAVSAPVNTARRIERLVKALLHYFGSHPEAFALLFRDPYGVREPEILSEAAAVQAELVREFSKLYASVGVPAERLVASTSGTVAYVMRIVELAVGGEIDREAAVDACMTCVLGVMGELGREPG
ncbi:MAG: regulatory protein TetR [Acidimicrobiales bacterium]|nr:regulatory protein TetR [Acidimicrobiales bacterium]